MKKWIFSSLLVLLFASIAFAQDKQRSFVIAGYRNNEFKTGGTAYFVEPTANCDPCILTAGHVYEPNTTFELSFDVDLYIRKNTLSLTFLAQSDKADIALFTADKVAVDKLNPYIWKISETGLRDGQSLIQYTSIWELNPQEFKYYTYSDNTVKGSYSKGNADYSWINKALNVIWNTLFFHTCNSLPGSSGSPIGNNFGELEGMEVGNIQRTIFLGVPKEDIKAFINSPLPTSQRKAVKPHKYLPVISAQ